MNFKKIDQFFQALGKTITQPVKIYITGGVLAWYYGGARPTEDLDFGFVSQKKSEDLVELFQNTAKDYHLTIEFSEDISRWGMVGFSDFTRGAKLYRKFGRVQVYYLDPMVWSVGKIGRYSEQDVEDLVLVFTKVKPTWSKLKKIWQQALLESPASLEKKLFLKRIEDFLAHYGKNIWGPNFQSDNKWEELFSSVKAKLR